MGILTEVQSRVKTFLTFLTPFFIFKIWRLSSFEIKKSLKTEPAKRMWLPSELKVLSILRYRETKTEKPCYCCEAFSSPMAISIDVAENANNSYH